MTKGKMNALLIIDMQKGSFTAATPRFDSDGAVKRINALAGKFRNSGSPVIFIQHDGSRDHEFIPHTADWELLDDLEIKSTDILIDKYANDSFYNSKLNSTLIEFNISNLFITGCATDLCVESTIQSALTRDYNVTVIANGHTTGNRPHLSAEKVIEHYNWVWKNMIPTQGKINVLSFEDIMKELDN